MSSDAEAVQAAHVAWMAAVNAGDVDRLLALMTPDAVFLNPGKAPFGPEKFPEGFTGTHERFLLHCTSAPDEIVVAGDMATTVCTDALSLTPRAGGETIQLAGHRLTVYRKQPDGRWLLARDAHTLTPVAR